MSDLNKQIKEQAAPGVGTRKENLERGADEVVAWALLVHEDTMRVVRGEQREYSFMPDAREKAIDLLSTYGLNKPGRSSDKGKYEFPTFNVFIGPKEQKQLPVADAEVVIED